MALTLRPARPADAVEMSGLLCTSIRDLCSADHLNDENRIANWTSNKSPEHIRGWIADAIMRLFVATLDGVIVGVGCLSLEGKVLLNYVAPAHRFQGISKMMMDAMEADLSAAGFSEIKLTSTVTAQQFYLSRGYEYVGEGGWDWGYPMVKHLPAKQT